MSDIFTIEELTRPYKVLIYGAAGSGKSTIASKAQNAAFIDLENGCPHIRIPKLKIDSLDTLNKSFGQIIESKYDTIVFDSLTYLEQLLFKKVAKENGKKSIADIAYHKGYELVLEDWVEFIKQLNKLNVKKNIICIAHSTVGHINDPELGEYDELAPSIHKKALGLLCADFDGIFCMKPQMIVTDEKAIKTKNVFIYTQPSNGIMAKSRFNLADKIERNNFDWNKVCFDYTK